MATNCFDCTEDFGCYMNCGPAIRNSGGWPTRPDGTNKTIGEMTDDERKPLIAAAIKRTRGDRS